MSFGKIEHKITDEEIAKQMAAFSSDEDSDDSDSDEEEEIDFEPKKKKQRISSTGSNSNSRSPLNETINLASDDESDIEDDSQDPAIEIIDDSDDEEDDILNKFKDIEAAKKKSSEGASVEETVWVGDDSDDEEDDNNNNKNVGVDVNVLLEQRRRQAEVDDDEDEDDDIFKTVERRQERERLSQFTFTIAITTKKALTIPYKKTDSLAGLKNKMLEQLKEHHPAEYTKFRNMNIKFEGAVIPTNIICSEWLEDEGLEDEDSVQLEIGS